MTSTTNQWYVGVSDTINIFTIILPTALIDKGVPFLFYFLFFLLLKNTLSRWILRHEIITAFPFLVQRKKWKLKSFYFFLRITRHQEFSQRSFQQKKNQKTVDCPLSLSCLTLPFLKELFILFTQLANFVSPFTPPCVASSVIVCVCFIRNVRKKKACFLSSAIILCMCH